MRFHLHNLNLNRKVFHLNHREYLDLLLLNVFDRLILVAGELFFGARLGET